MRFELNVALKYLIPRWRQLSVSIISLISILVISLVVWLVVIFLSVTEGMEKKWVNQLISLNAPVRMAPTEAYYNSYFYKVDALSDDSDYMTKTIGEKLAALKSDPYDPDYDMELPPDFPSPHRQADGELIDPVKGGYHAINSINGINVRPQEYEVTFGNLQINLLRHEDQSHLNQVTYVASHDEQNSRLEDLLVPLSAADYHNLLFSLPTDQRAIHDFFSHLSVSQLKTGDHGFILPPSLYPKQGEVTAVGLMRDGEIRRVVIPADSRRLTSLQNEQEIQGFETEILTVDFADSPPFPILLDRGIPFEAELVEQRVDDPAKLEFAIQGRVQGLPIHGETYFQQLTFSEVTPLEGAGEPPWVYQDEQGHHKIPTAQRNGEGVLIANHFQKSGVRLGDRGHLAYFAPGGSSMQEQRLPIYVAGFYDPGMLPVGGKLLFVNPDIVALLRGNITVSDSMLGNGINLWVDSADQAVAVKERLIAALEKLGIGQYWKVESFDDYEFARPVLQQLKSDKNLFTLIAIIILIVACSNIISMLILLVNDKKKEIGILQALGASPRRIAAIFGICGFSCGVISCIFGTLAALFTLRHLQSLVNLLSFFQGHEAFQAAFYGDQLPNQLSLSALTFVVIATLAISLLAGIVPAVKAARVRPSEILRGD